MAINYNAPQLPDDKSTDVNSYISRSQGDINMLGDVQGGEDQQSQLLKQTIKRELTQPVTDKLSSEDYYPGINRGINVGTFSGPMGSIPLLAAGQPHIPFAMLNELEKSKQATISKYQQELLKGIAFDYVPLKNKITGQFFNERKHAADVAYYNSVKQKFGGNAILANNYIKNDPEFAYNQEVWKNFGKAIDDNMDYAMQIILSKEGGQFRYGMADEKDKKGKLQQGEKSDEKQTEKFWTGGGQEMWVSDETYQKAKDFMEMVTNPNLSVEDIKNFDVSGLQTAMATGKLVKQMTDILADKNDLETTFARAFQDKLGKVNTSPYELDEKGNPKKDKKGNLIPNKSLDTNINNVYMSVKESTLTDTYMQSLMKPMWEDMYSGMKEKPSFDKFYNQYRPFVRQTLEKTLDKVGRDNIAQRVAAEKSLREKAIPVVITKKTLPVEGGGTLTTQVKMKQLPADAQVEFTSTGDAVYDVLQKKWVTDNSVEPKKPINMYEYIGADGKKVQVGEYQNMSTGKTYLTHSNKVIDAFEYGRLSKYIEYKGEYTQPEEITTPVGGTPTTEDPYNVSPYIKVEQKQNTPRGGSSTGGVY